MKRFLMDLLIGENLVPGTENLRREARLCSPLQHTVIEELKSDEGHLPRFSARTSLFQVLPTQDWYGILILARGFAGGVKGSFDQSPLVATTLPFDFYPPHDYTRREDISVGRN